MTRKELYEAWRARPFRPFVLRMPDGRALPVPHPEFLSIPPTAGRIVSVHVGGVFRLVDLFLVSDIEFRPVPRRGKRRRSA